MLAINSFIKNGYAAFVYEDRIEVERMRGGTGKVLYTIKLSKVWGLEEWVDNWKRGRYISCQPCWCMFSFPKRFLETQHYMSRLIGGGAVLVPVSTIDDKIRAVYKKTESN